MQVIIWRDYRKLLLPNGSRADDTAKLQAADANAKQSLEGGAPQVDVFDLDAELVGRYQSFARSFTTVRAADIKSQIDAIYDRGDFWPEPLIGLNPRYLDGPTTGDLVNEGAADSALAEVFALGDPRQPIRLFRHQEQAFHKAPTAAWCASTTMAGRW